MIFSYNWLQSFFGKKLPKPEKLAELLTMHSFEVGEKKKKGNDWILDIDVLPNRAPDCFSHIGIAREIAAITGLKFQHPPCKTQYTKHKIQNAISVEVKDKTVCSRYTAKVITDIKVGPSPKWLKERLAVCGLNSINNIVDIANYVMLETGQPLHAFDSEKLEGGKIIVRFAKRGEKITTLDGQKFDLNSDVLVIADNKKPIAIAGIKGGKSPEIDKKTRVVVLESANFEPRIIRRASRKLNLRTDASLRFEHGIDPNLTESAINRAAFLIQKLAGGKIVKGLIDFYPQKVLSKRVKLDMGYVEKLLGMKIPAKEIRKILTSLEMKVREKTSCEVEVLVPTFRLDISRPEDLVEEIGRIYGYEKIPAVFPIASLIPPKRNEEVFWKDMMKNILKEAKFTEVYNYSFISEKDAETFGCKNKDLIELENPMSSEQKYLRPSLIYNLLKDVKKNLSRKEEIRIFELGKIFTNNSKEKRQLAGLITGGAFYQLKGVTDLLLHKLGISSIWYDDWQPTPEGSKISIWHPKKCAEIKIDGTEVGFLGEISPKILAEMKIPIKVVAFNFDFEKLQKLVSEEQEYMPLSKFPSAVRDLAILVPPKTKVVQVLNKINVVGGSLVRDVDLFDIYEGDKIASSKKNLAFHIIYQSETRTLKSKEVDEVHQKIIKALEENPEWQVRK